MKALVALNPYGATLTLTDSRSTFLRLSGADSDGACGMTAQGDGGYIVGVFDGTLNTVVHECTHVVLDLLEDRGMDVQSDQGEAMAYMMGWLVQECTHKLRLFKQVEAKGGKG